MRISGRKLLNDAIAAAPRSQKALDIRAWLQILENSRWAGTADLMKTFPNAVAKGNSKWLFPLVRSGATITAIVGFRGAGQIVIRQVQ